MSNIRRFRRLNHEEYGEHDMSRLDRGTHDRLRTAFDAGMSAETRDAHLAAIVSELNIGAVAIIAPTPWWRLRAAGLAAAMLVVVPVGTAIASEGAGPGDFLYPVKLLVEPFRSVVDSDVVARHRADELAHIIDTPQEVDRLTDAITDAQDATSDLPADHRLRVYVEELTDTATDRPVHEDRERDVVVVTDRDASEKDERDADVVDDTTHETTTTTIEAPTRSTDDTTHRTTTTTTTTVIDDRARETTTEATRDG